MFAWGGSVFIQVFRRTLPVSNNPCTFILKQCQENRNGAAFVGLNVQHSLPDSRQVSEVEDVVKFGRRGKHFDLKSENEKSTLDLFIVFNLQGTRQQKTFSMTTFVLCHKILPMDTRRATMFEISSSKFLHSWKYPHPITPVKWIRKEMKWLYFVKRKLSIESLCRWLPNILSMEELDGSVQLKTVNCLFSLCGMSFLPPPGWIIAASIWMSTMLVKSPGLSRLYMPFISIIWRTISLVIWNTWVWPKFFSKKKHVWKANLLNVLMAHLISPFIHYRHVYVIDKDCHPAPTRRSIGAANSFLNIALNSSLQSQK